MHRSYRLKMVLQLLLAGGAAALGAAPACDDDPCPEDPWTEPEEVMIDSPAVIRAVVRGQGMDHNYGVGDDGAIVELFGERRTMRPVTADLKGVAVAGTEVIAVGAGGTVVVGSDGRDEWTVVDVGTTADLWQVLAIAGDNEVVSLLVAGDGVMLHRDVLGEWHELAAPEGEWGELRAMVAVEGGAFVFGRGGVVWAAGSELVWRREDAGTRADLVTATVMQDDSVIAAGADGVIVWRTPESWTRIDQADIGEDIVDVAPGLVLTTSGRLFDDGGVTGRSVGNALVERWTLTADLGDGPHVLLVEPWSDEMAVREVFVLGDPGSHRKIENRCMNYQQSLGCYGRPFVVAAEVRAAAAVRRGDWCVGAEEEERAELAAWWRDAALDEHASVAAFARAALELMSVGAPPELLRETAAAMQDEVEHARLCFGQARRFGAGLLGPGPLAIEGSLTRAGDPVAIAVAVLMEGCVGEGIAAAVAGVAAEGCEDGETRAVLRRIAADEARHAALAWKTLRWLVTEHGEEVTGPLRARLAAVGRTRVEDDGSELRRFGRLGARERGEIQDAVIAAVVRPLMRRLLERSERGAEVRT